MNQIKSKGLKSLNKDQRGPFTLVYSSTHLLYSKSVQISLLICCGNSFTVQDLHLLRIIDSQQFQNCSGHSQIWFGLKFTLCCLHAFSGQRNTTRRPSCLSASKLSVPMTQKRSKRLRYFATHCAYVSLYNFRSISRTKIQ